MSGCDGCDDDGVSKRFGGCRYSESCGDDIGSSLELSEKNNSQSYLKMSTCLLREHMREYHNFRWKKEINANPSLNNFNNTAIENAPPQKKKKIVGKKIKRKINKERKKIISYQKDLTGNVQHNISILKRLSIQTQRNAPQWQDRLEMIKNATHSLGK